MSSRTKKILLVLLTVVLLAGAGGVERVLNHERDALGLTRYTELKGAPPVLALTTVALGGFRGLISNALWMRMSELQEEDKYFEMVQLADWITKLEPHFTQVWLHQAWNMAYNISVKLKDPQDRWRWVSAGIELLRDEGLKYNPNDVLIHRELAWFYQHKMGANLDDAHLYYKQMWAGEMATVFGHKEPNLDELINPQTDDERRRAALLRDKFKLDSVFMKEVDEKYGPLEWRLPEAHAIYWAAQGLEAAKRNPRQVSPDDLITLRRVIYQSMQLSFQRGRLIANKATHGVFEFGPNLNIIGKVSAAYEQAMDEDAKNRDHIQTAHRNFLRDAVYFLYTYDRKKDAAAWFKYLCEHYPNKPLITMQTDSMPGQMSLDDYCIARVQDEVNSPGEDKTKIIMEGLERTSLISLALGEYDRATAMQLMAQQLYVKYEDKIKMRKEPLDIPTPQETRKKVLDDLLNNQLTGQMADQLRTELGLSLPARTATNTPASDAVSTNAPAADTTPTNAPAAEAGGQQ